MGAVSNTVDYHNDDEGLLQAVQQINKQHHFGVDRTLALAQEAYGSGVSWHMVKKVVSRCEKCTHLCPAVRNRWKAGNLATTHVWAIIYIAHFSILIL